MLKKTKILFVYLLLGIVSACQAENVMTQINNTQQFQDYGDKNATKFKEKLIVLQQSPLKNNLKILQIGDSHTAGDFFTDRLRQRLQKMYGKGSLGWAAPMNVHGQRNALFRYQASAWVLSNSRKDSDVDYALGGFIAKPIGPGYLSIEPREIIPHPIPIKVLIKRKDPEQSLPVVSSILGNDTINIPADNQWHSILLIQQPPLIFKASDYGQYEIGGVWFNNKGSGVTVTAVGSNGAQQTLWKKWNLDSFKQSLLESQPDLVILAYGTNEAFNDQLDLIQTRQQLVQGIRNIRSWLPETVILIIGAPDSLRTKGENTIYCQGKRPKMLDAVKTVQRDVAIEEKTLFWDWQSAMGGKCAMLTWQAKGWAQADGVHFKQQGYEKSADILLDNLLSWIHNK